MNNVIFYALALAVGTGLILLQEGERKLKRPLTHDQVLLTLSAGGVLVFANVCISGLILNLFSLGVKKTGILLCIAYLTAVLLPELFLRTHFPVGLRRLTQAVSVFFLLIRPEGGFWKRMAFYVCGGGSYLFFALLLAFLIREKRKGKREISVYLTALIIGAVLLAVFGR